MREIKFRGRSVEGSEELGIKKGDWIYGDLVRDGKSFWIVGEVVESNDEYISLEQWIPVVPKTIGQLTGLKDKKGKEIWEGDIVRQWKYNYVVKFGEYMVDGLDFYSNHTEAGFYLESPQAEPGNTSGIRPTDCEVIGNIYENKELLDALHKQE